jgi:fructose-specific phosphotransferase system IIA component
MHVKLMEMIREDLIFPELNSANKGEVLREMAKGMAKAIPALSEERLFQVIMERERLSSTGIGSGIALPHAKLDAVADHWVAVGRSRTGVDFEAIDSKPVHLIFLIVGPVGANETHLKALARISKFLHDTHFRDQLVTAENANGMFSAMMDKDAQY